MNRLFQDTLKFFLRLSPIRFYSDCEGSSNRKGLVLGAYDGCNPGEFILTQTASKFNEETDGKLMDLLKGAPLKLGKAQVLTNLSPEFQAIAVAGLGKKEAGFNTLESVDECKENVRKAAGIGARAILDQGIPNILVEGMTAAECAAEGASLATWHYQEFKHKEGQKPRAKLDLFEDPDREGWQRGLVKGECQNVARALEEAPANHLTPTTLAQKAIDILCPCGVQVDIRDKNWLDANKFSAFLSMAKGSCEAPLFLEVGYCAANPEEKPVVFVCKGVTFDTGGICLKKCAGMSEFRAEMAGAAVAIGLFKCAAQMNLPLNMNAFIPLCENMTGGLALKPGDVVTGINGKSICVQDTDNDGRIILTDPLSYSEKLKPCLVFTITSLSMGSKKALGSGASAVFTESEMIWRELNRAGGESGDRVWRLPMWKIFKERVTGYIGYDLHNVGKSGPDAEPCLGAAFLKEFVPKGSDYAHIDIMGTGLKATSNSVPYLKQGLMTGRPLRTIAQFLYQMSCPHEKGEECG